MQPSFCGRNPFLTGKRQKKSQCAEMTLAGWTILLPSLLLSVYQMYRYMSPSSLTVSTSHENKQTTKR